MLDYDVVTILPAKSSEAQPFRTIYCERVAMYKTLDGQQTRRNCRMVLLEMLDGLLRLFPEVASKSKGRFSFGSLDDLWLRLAVAAAPFCLIINMKGVRNISLC